MVGKVFKSGNSLALRLPKELNPVDGEVHIEPRGEKWIVTPARAKRWPDHFFPSAAFLS